MNYVFGVDLGGTTVKMGLFTEEGMLLDKWEIKTDTSNNGENILPDISATIQAKMEERNISKGDVLGIGMGVPGPVTEDGTIIKGTNLGWGVFNVEAKMTELTGYPCKVGNDANVAGYGEMFKGGGMGYSDMVMITLGTGLGCGIIIGGNILAGTRGSAGEIGHICVNPDETEVCGCGNKGCLEQYVSANGIARVAKRMLAAFDGETSLRTVENITAKDVFDAAKEKDAFALNVVENFGDLLGKYLAAVATVVNPEAFVIGGGVSKAGDILLDTIVSHFKKYAFHSMRDTTEFKLAKLGNDAGIYGCAKMILNKVEKMRRYSGIVN